MLAKHISVASATAEQIDSIVADATTTLTHRFRGLKPTAKISDRYAIGKAPLLGKGG